MLNFQIASIYFECQNLFEKSITILVSNKSENVNFFIFTLIHYFIDCSLLKKTSVQYMNWNEEVLEAFNFFILLPNTEKNLKNDLFYHW